jgi:hypothetical protein
MEEARAVLARLERIEALERDCAGLKPLLAELRELVREATDWAERERDPRAREAAAALAEAERVDANPILPLHRSHEQAVPSASAAAAAPIG